MLKATSSFEMKRIKMEAWVEFFSKVVSLEFVFIYKHIACIFLLRTDCSMLIFVASLCSVSKILLIDKWTSLLQWELVQCYSPFLCKSLLFGPVCWRKCGFCRLADFQLNRSVCCRANICDLVILLCPWVVQKAGNFLLDHPLHVQSFI